jgi:UDP-N-acetylmuramoyl-L-alanyl-D-glutamate--2,6-diaminopimelate ligase
MPTLLRRLLADVGDARVSGDPDVLISSITVDSRRVERGALFACVRGARADGHAFARAAVLGGAVAVLAEREIDVPETIPTALVPDVLAALSPIAAALYRRPSAALTCVGVTGTNGKTTTTHFIEAIARAAHRPFGLVGTLGARLAGTFDVALEHTTPYAHEIQALLARFLEAGATGAVLEVSSHALSLHRVDDVAFDVAALTNVTHDHLDFHGTFEEYAGAKRRLFETNGRGGIKAGGASVLNLDDAVGRSLAARAKRRMTYALENGDAMLRATDIAMTAAGSTFWVRSLRPAPFSIALPGPFNVANAMAAIAVACALDFDVEAIDEGLASVREIPGRMTAVPAPGFGVYVDYAHTPEGLRNVLSAARAIATRRLLCVFGCGGDRDPLKRPIMGRIARELADHVVVTSDNPRFEDPMRIIEDVLAGIEAAGGAQFEVVPDRGEAIERAVSLARPGDVVVIAGKGHEPYQLVGDERLPFSDVSVAERAIRKVSA